jgi:hypothetical protein
LKDKRLGVELILYGGLQPRAEGIRGVSRQEQMRIENTDVELGVPAKGELRIDDTQLS